VSALGSVDETERVRRIVILAGRKSHGPEGNGIHDYPAQARLLHSCLKRCQLADRMTIVRIEDGEWSSIEVRKADCVIVISDGRDGDLPYAEATHLASPERIADVETAVACGSGIVAVHFSTFASESNLTTAQRWQGACFHWEQNGKREWRSKITWARGMLDHAVPGHPVLRGVGGGALHEEYYHRLSYHPQAVPLITVRALPGDSDAERAVAWALERLEGGRGFGTTMGHSLDSFHHDGFRTLLLNGIAWAAGLTPPEDGLRAAFVERELVDHHLGIGPLPGPIRVAVLAGNAAHRWHNWPETTAAMLRAWGDDSRITARVHTDPADLSTALSDRDVLVLNWCNWQDPMGMPAAAQSAIHDFTARGGGVFIHNFANGACHSSLPGAGESDWPWYRTLVRRVWEHRALAPGPSSHDRFRAFQVSPCGGHPLVAGLPAFTLEDELYWRQHGYEPIEPLLTARSDETGADEPLAWTYDVGNGRVVQSLLGHSAKTYDAAPMCAFVRRAIAWCARRAMH